ncbi:class I tRNA ligase family protein [Candidatus Nomurabacteria bacterium]|nr:class I tRNA ligase family protein [Candidatus Nomurabacteria bacterium]
MENDSKKSDSALREERILKFWQENKIFEKTLEATKDGKEFVFFEGPPTANAKPALHHLEARAFKDVIPRYKTMRGYHVPRRGGWDTHGLPVELQIEKKLGLNSKKAIEEYGIEKFNAECKESVFQYIKDWEDFTDRIGYWVDKKNAYFTFDNSYIESLWSVLAHVDKRGLLYKDYRIVPWCARCGTPLASHELAQGYEDVKDLSIFVKFKIKSGQEIFQSSGRSTQPDVQNFLPASSNVYLLAWTTTPWTLPGNVALAVGENIDYGFYKKDGEILVVAESLAEKVLKEGFEKTNSIKGSELAGLSYEPLYNFIKPNEKSHKVYTADFVTTEDGTGIVHIAPMYGADDFELGTKVGLPKEHVVGVDGKFLPNTGFFSGRFAMEKDESGKPTLAVDVIKDLQARGLFFDKKNYEHTYPHCWRCKTPLIYYARDSWFIGMESLRDELVKENEGINWEPAHIREGRFGEWLRNIKDWSLSRERYWGTPLPVWESEDGERIVVDSTETLRKYSKKSGNKYFVMRHGQGEQNVVDIRSSKADAPYHLTDLGKKEAHDSAIELKGKGITKIICSPFVRTRETAEIVADVLDFPKNQIVIEDRVSEYNHGSFDGKTSAEFNEWRKSANAGFDTKAPGGESLKDAKIRIAEFVYELENKYKGENILIVSHGVCHEVMSSIVNAWTDKETWENWQEKIVLTGGCKQYDFTPLPHNKDFELDLHRPFIDDVVLEKDGKEFRRVKEVMDVWFDSGAMPFAQDHYPFENKKRLDGGLLQKAKGFPADFISEAIDQTRGWFYTLHAVGVLMGKGKAYKNVICLGHILDEKGKKMSKSIGNIVNPWEMMDKYGVDTLRLWMYSVNQPGDSKNFDEKTVAELRNKVFNLFYNVLAFYELYRDQSLEKREIKSENVLDVWILSEFNKLVTKMTENLDNYKLFEPVRALRDFIDDLSTWYLRRSRDRLKDGDTDAKVTLYFVLKNMAKLFAPFAPFSAEDIWQKLRLSEDVESVHLAEWPKIEKIEEKVLESMKVTREIVTLGLEARQKANIKVRQPLAKITINQKLDEEYLNLLKDELNVKEIVSGEKFELDTNLTDELRREGDFREFLRGVQDLRKDANLLPSDLVNLSVPESSKEIILGFEDELKKVAGIKEIKWGGEEVRIEK